MASFLCYLQSVVEPDTASSLLSIHYRHGTIRAPPTVSSAPVTWLIDEGIIIR